MRLVYAYIRAEQKRFRESVVNLVTARVRPERNFRRGNVHEGALVARESVGAQSALLGELCRWVGSVTRVWTSHCG